MNMIRMRYIQQYLSSSSMSTLCRCLHLPPHPLFHPILYLRLHLRQYHLMSRWVWGFMIRATSASSAKAIRSFAEKYSPPRALLTDNATHFHGAEMNQVCADFSIHHLFSSECVSHTNGLAEREISSAH